MPNNCSKMLAATDTAKTGASGAEAATALSGDVPASHRLDARRRAALTMLVGVRTVGVEEELLVVDPSGRPVPLGPAALQVAAARGEGETVDEHDRAERADGDPATVDDPAARLVPELKTQQLEFGTRVCTALADVATDLEHWRERADAAARGVGARRGLRLDVDR